MDKQELGSETAKSGFKNEDFIATEFSKGEKSKHAKKWLTEMGYDTTKITKIDAKTSRELGLGSVKSDVIVFVNEDRIGISAKKAIADFNQIDKRWTDTYQELLKIPNDVVVILKKYVGEEGFQPKDFSEYRNKKLKDKRRLYIDELSEKEQERLISYLESIKEKIFEMVLRGEGKDVAEWLLVIKYNNRKEMIDSKIVTIGDAIKHFSKGKVTTTKRGVLKIGQITLQRKGGDGGRKTAQMLQFKFSPNEIFNIEKERK